MASVEAQLKAILDEYNIEVEDASKEAAKEASDKAVRTLKDTSPRRANRGGGYAKSWTAKRQDVGILTGYVVYNRRYPGLTHLLEHGHAAVNQYGPHGRTPARPHIKAAEQESIAEFERLVREKIGGI